MNYEIHFVPNNLSYDEFNHLIQWLDKELDLSKYKNPIQIEFFNNKRFATDNGILSDGTILTLDFKKRAREFEIHINKKLERKEFIKTVCHEMWHVKQKAMGRWYDTYDPYVNKWMNRSVNLYENSYHEYPWEIEAFIMEEKLFQKYRKEVNVKD